jgi:uncharacterized HhH-GPD family protein
MLHLSQDQAADQLITEDPLALLIGMVLDQQMPLERAFRAPLELQHRLESDLDARAIAAMNPDRLVEVFCIRPALHRFPAANAKRVQDLCRLIVEDYDGDPAAIWTTASDAAGRFGADGSYLSVADITDEESLGKVLAYKAQMKAAAKAATASV